MPKKIITVVSGKGGVGKTTFAVNVASYMSMAGFSTVLIDADIYNPCIFFHLGLAPSSRGLQELLEGEAKLEEVIPIHPATGLRCISSSIHEYRNPKVDRLGKVVRQLDYEYIFIDCPPGFSPLIEEAVGVSDEIFVMMTPDMPSATAALKLVTFIRHHFPNKADSTFVYPLNRVSNTPYEVHPREIESLFKAKISASIPEDSNVPRSISAKTPLILLNPSSPFSRAVKRFSSDLLHKHRGISEILLPRKAAEEIKTGNGGLQKLLSLIANIFKPKEQPQGESEEQEEPQAQLPKKADKAQRAEEAKKAQEAQKLLAIRRLEEKKRAAAEQKARLERMREEKERLRAEEERMRAEKERVRTQKAQKAQQAALAKKAQAAKKLQEKKQAHGKKGNGLDLMKLISDYRKGRKAQ